MQTRRLSYMSSICAPEISLPRWATGWDKNEYAVFVFTFTPGRPICLRVQKEADVSLYSSCFVCRHCLQSEEGKHEMAAGGSGASC